VTFFLVTFSSLFSSEVDSSRRFLLTRPGSRSLGDFFFFSSSGSVSVSGLESILGRRRKACLGLEDFFFFFGFFFRFLFLSEPEGGLTFVIAFIAACGMRWWVLLIFTFLLGHHPFVVTMGGLIAVTLTLTAAANLGLPFRLQERGCIGIELQFQIFAGGNRLQQEMVAGMLSCIKMWACIGMRVTTTGI